MNTVVNIFYSIRYCNYYIKMNLWESVGDGGKGEIGVHTCVAQYYSRVVVVQRDYTSYK
jgi:hypothetical protein